MRAGGERLGGRPTRSGLTMVELLVVLVLLGLVATIGGVGVATLRPTTEAARLDTLRSARSRAIRTGAQIMLEFHSTTMRFLPDGRVLGGPVDPLTGAWAHAE